MTATPPVPSHSSAPRPAGWSRRSFLRASAVGGASLAAWPGTGAAQLTPLGEPRADAVIQIFLAGGLSHIDSFDPKPDAAVDYRGEFKAIASTADGERLSEVLRRTAKVADRLTLVRSMTHGEAAHERGTHTMLTGYQPSPVVTYPAFGAVVGKMLGGRNHLPAYVCVPRGSTYSGTGYLSAAFAPFELGSDPNSNSFKVRDLASPKAVDEARSARRRELLGKLDRGFGERAHADGVEASKTFYEQAYALIDSPDARAAFDIQSESAKVRERYGRTGIGQRLLMARRLVKAGVRYVTVVDGGYDHHTRIFPSLRSRLTAFDRGYAALIAELDAEGMLDRTMVMVTSEFGRTPRINRDGGRDHWPRSFTVALAGGGVRRGYVHGASNAIGAEPDGDAVTPADIAATMFTQLGIDPAHKLITAADRPIDLVRDGRVVRELLS